MVYFIKVNDYNESPDGGYLCFLVRAKNKKEAIALIHEHERDNYGCDNNRELFACAPSYRPQDMEIIEVKDNGESEIISDVYVGR